VIAVITHPSAEAQPVRSGSPQHDFDDFYATAFPILRSQLYAYLGDRAEAQDVVQEAFCRAFAKWKSISGYSDPFSWVRRVAWNLATSKFRRQRTASRHLSRQREEHADGPSPDRVALVRALSKISPQLRKAIVLHYIGQLSVAEIALQEDVAEGTVKSWLNRGRAALSEQLAEAKESR
jgi:RNA polymerase sigma-70 factor (ECF subfamily)